MNTCNILSTYFYDFKEFTFIRQEILLKIGITEIVMKYDIYGHFSRLLLKDKNLASNSQMSDL